jgi:hypothetical protein
MVHLPTVSWRAHPPGDPSAKQPGPSTCANPCLAEMLHTSHQLMANPGGKVICVNNLNWNPVVSFHQHA